jgi:hypothetical protein
MTKNSPTPRWSRGRVFLYLFLFLGTIGILLYLEQVAVIVVLASVGLFVLLLLVAFRDLDKVATQAQIEARLIDESDTEPSIPKGANKVGRNYRVAIQTPDQPGRESGRFAS